MKTTLNFCCSSTEDRFISMNREIEFNGFIPVGYDVICGGFDFTVENASYNLRHSVVQAYLNPEDGEVYDPETFLRIVATLLNCDFEIDAEDFPDGEKSVCDVLRDLGWEKAKFEDGK